MLNHILKTFKISIFSGALSIVQPSIVLAAGTNTTDQNGTITNTQTHSFDKVTDTDMLAGIAMLAGGVVTGRMLKNYDDKTPDIMIAGAAGAAFIAGEILSNVKFKGTIDEMTVEVTKKSDGTVNEEQIKRLQDLKKSYEEAKSTTETKKKLQMASAVAFTAAAAYAGYLAYTEKQAEIACKATIANGRNSLSACPEAANGGSGAPACGKCVTQLSMIERVMGRMDSIRNTPQPSESGNITASKIQTRAESMNCLKPPGPTPTAVDSAVTASCDQTYLKILKRNQAHSKDPARLGYNNIFNELIKKGSPTLISYELMQTKQNYNSYLDRLVGLIFPRAEASWIPLLGFGVATAASFALTTQAVAVETDNFMLSPVNRGFVFAGFAVVAALSAKASDNVIGKLDENIKKIDGILFDLNKMANGIKAQNLSQQQIKIQTIDPSKQSQILFSKDGSVKTECLTSNSTENCKSAEDQIKNMPGFANLPDSFRDVASQSVALGDSVSGKNGISGATLASADVLAKNQNALSNLLKGRQDAYEKLTGQKGLFAKGQNDAMDKIRSATMKSLQKQGMTASGMMASIGGTPINSSAVKSTIDDLSKVTPSANVVDISAKDSDKEKGKDEQVLKFKLADDQSNTPTDLSSPSDKSAPEYVIDSKEINGQNGPSLFEVISSRYLKSAYPKLLEEIPLKN